MIQSTPEARAIGRVGLTAVAAVLLVGALATPAWADINKMKEQIQQFTLKLADLEKADEEKGAIQELKLSQLWLNEAQAHLVKEEEEPAAKFLRRVEISIEMIGALIEQAKAERSANDRESAAIKLKQEMQAAKVELEQAEARKKTLQEQMTKAPEPGGKP